MFGLGLGRLTRWAFELIAVSTILAGVRRSTGFAPHTALITDTTLRSFIDSYFRFGETVFSTISAYVVNSRYFMRQFPTSGLVSPPPPRQTLQSQGSKEDHTAGKGKGDPPGYL